jgi:hypothetical protein
MKKIGFISVLIMALAIGVSWAALNDPKGKWTISADIPCAGVSAKMNLKQDFRPTFFHEQDPILTLDRWRSTSRRTILRPGRQSAAGDVGCHLCVALTRNSLVSSMNNPAAAGGPTKLEIK